MNKVAMPEPLAWMFDEANQIGRLSTRLCWARHGVPPAYGQNHKGLVTVETAEAYAAARVREALEEAASLAMNAPISAEMLDSEGAKAASFHASARIRALIPSTPA